MLHCQRPESGSFLTGGNLAVLLPENSESMVPYMTTTEGEEKTADTGAAWKILIVDDEQQVHSVTTMALMGVEFDNRPLEFLSAYSAEEARQVIADHPDLAIILLDVVMETDDAGLKLVEYVRETVNNKDVRIIIRTGQAGLVPERAAVAKYDINGFREKTELTADKLFSTVYTALSSYRDLHALREEVTRRRQVEKLQIKQSSELQKANTSLKQFASLASHDMKEPLRKILIFGERLEAKLGDKIIPEVKTYLEKVRDSAERLTTLIRDLQVLSKLDASKPDIRELQLDAVLDDVLKEYESNIKQAGATVEHGAMPAIEADKTCIELLFQNLLSNALKYSKPQVPMKLKFSARVVEASEDSPLGKLCEIRAEDNGVGIDPQYKEKIFENFFRLHGKEIAGTGIGLALCKQLVELHHGSIRVEGELGKGVTFIITLPMRQPR